MEDDTRRYLELSVRRLFATDEFTAPVDWDLGLKLTMVDLLRDLYVSQHQLSWVSLPPSQRRLVYADIAQRIIKNALFGVRDLKHGIGASRYKTLDELLEETVDRLMLRDEMADHVVPLTE